MWLPQWMVEGCLTLEWRSGVLMMPLQGTRMSAVQWKIRAKTGALPANRVLIAINSSSGPC